jgi:hypothetical protein
MSHVYEKAVIHILDWFHHAERDLIGKVVATFNGETGRILSLRLDDHHSLCFTFDPERASDPALGITKPETTRRWYPVSTIKQVAL